MEGAVLFRAGDGAAHLVINRPEKRNAINMAVATELVEILERCGSDSELRVVTLTGAGDVAFCAGNDLAEFQSRASDPARMREFDQAVLKMHGAIRKFPRVVVAVVNGYCLGGGVTLLGACDLALASDRAQFGLPEVARGTWPALATTTVMHTLNRKQALYLILTGKRIDAQEAANLGLINRVVPHDRLEEEAKQLVGEIASHDPTVLEWAKKMADDSTRMDYERSFEYGLSASHVFRSMSRVFDEGIATFLKKK